MDAHIDDCLVVNYEHRIKNLSLPDENDRHILAAAIEARAEAIVTGNLKDFPPALLAEFSIYATTCDDFLMDLLSTHEEAGEMALQALVLAIHKRLRNPPITLQEYFKVLENLEGNALTKTVAHLKQIT